MQRHYFWGGAFVEANREQIQRLLHPRHCVSWYYRGEIVSIPLVGPNGQFNIFFDMLKDRYVQKEVTFINVSGELETVIAIGIDKIRFFRMPSSRGIAVFGLFEYNNLLGIDLSRYQIFNESAGEWDETEEPCLIHTLRLCNVKTCKVVPVSIENTACRRRTREGRWYRWCSCNRCNCRRS